MDETQIFDFRLSFRLTIMEHLALRTALIGPVSARALSVEESRKSLKDWLDANSSAADDAYGKHFRDPAMTALYADEAKDVIEKYKGIVDKTASQLSSTGTAP
jgi:hypothetical protein